MHGHAYLSSIGHRALRKGRVSMSNRVYHVTTATKQREPFFADPRAACAACHCFENHVLLRDARMLAWVLMPDHAHWLIELGGARTLQGIVGTLKTFSARNANRAIGRRGPIWALAFHDHALRDEDGILATARYIVANPLRAALVDRVGDYPYWNSAFL
jgi:REP element-mobilizing transposase RayT